MGRYFQDDVVVRVSEQAPLRASTGKKSWSTKKPTHVRGPTALTLDISEPGEVTASLIAVSPDVQVEIVTPDQYLCTLDAGAELHATLTAERGTSYAEIPLDAGGATGILRVASLFTPIRRAQYAVESARIGPITTYDRLVLEIEHTDGTLTPDDALHAAATDLLGHVTRVSTATRSGAAPAPVVTTLPVVLRPAPADDTPLDALGLSPRAYNALRHAGLTTVGDVLARSTADLAHVRKFGRHSAAELRDALVRAGALDAAHAATRFADLIGEGDAGAE